MIGIIFQLLKIDNFYTANSSIVFSLTFSCKTAIFSLEFSLKLCYLWVEKYGKSIF